MPRPRNPKGDREFWESLSKNMLSWRAYYNRLVELSISSFDWQNIPDTIDVRFMELALFGEGHAVFFYDDVLGYLCLRCAVGGQYNVYRIPTRETGIIKDLLIKIVCLFLTIICIQIPYLMLKYSQRNCMKLIGLLT